MKIKKLSIIVMVALVALLFVGGAAAEIGSAWLDSSSSNDVPADMSSYLSGDSAAENVATESFSSPFMGFIQGRQVIYPADIATCENPKHKKHCIQGVYVAENDATGSSSSSSPVAMPHRNLLLVAENVAAGIPSSMQAVPKHRMQGVWVAENFATQNIQGRNPQVGSVIYTDGSAYTAKSDASTSVVNILPGDKAVATIDSSAVPAGNSVTNAAKDVGTYSSADGFFKQIPGVRK